MLRVWMKFRAIIHFSIATDFHFLSKNSIFNANGIHDKTYLSQTFGHILTAVNGLTEAKVVICLKIYESHL